MSQDDAEFVDSGNVKCRGISGGLADLNIRYNIKGRRRIDWIKVESLPKKDETAP